MSDFKLPSSSELPTIEAAALKALPIFPLPSTLLLPQTIISLHIFEPRYRRMLEDIADGYRTLAVAMLDESGQPDRFGRPPVFPIAGVGVLRRSAKLPDGRYNILVEGVVRADITDELDPLPNVPYRRVRARPLIDVQTAPREAVDSAVSALRALTSRVISEMGGTDAEIMERLNEIEEPGTLADLIAAAAVQDPIERQKILAEVDVLKRIELAAGALGTLVLRAREVSPKSTPLGWGGTSGEA